MRGGLPLEIKARLAERQPAQRAYKSLAHSEPRAQMQILCFGLSARGAFAHFPQFLLFQPHLGWRPLLAPSAVLCRCLSHQSLLVQLYKGVVVCEPLGLRSSGSRAGLQMSLRFW